MIFIAPLVVMADFIKIDKDKILQRHNELRKKHFNVPLVYSDKLEKSSKKWALHLAKEEGCYMVHSHGIFGENLFWASTEIHKTKRSNEKKWHIVRTAQKIKNQ